MNAQNLVGLLATARTLEGSIILEGTALQEERKLRAEIYKSMFKIKNLKNKKAIVGELKNIASYFNSPPKNSESNSDWCEVKGSFDVYCMSHHCFACPANTLGPYYNPNSKLIKVFGTFNTMKQMNNKLENLANQLGCTDIKLVDYIRSRAK
jgi:hypothetical protein